MSLLAAIVLALSPAHHHGHYPAFWKRESACIRFEESRGEWHLRDGAYQITPSTWAAFKVPGWTTLAGQASPPRQTFVAWRIWVHKRPELGRERSVAVERESLRSAVSRAQ